MSFTHESIQLFYSNGSSKGMNDAENKVRESILVFLANPLPPNMPTIPSGSSYIPGFTRHCVSFAARNMVMLI
jgi:hypothetical protein